MVLSIYPVERRCSLIEGDEQFRLASSECERSKAMPIVSKRISLPRA